MTHLEIAFLFVLSYVLGGIPTGYIIGRMNGIDIRKVGSGNPGTANVLRNLGLPAGLLTLLVDFMKGFLPTWIAVHFMFDPNNTVWFSRGHWWIPVTVGALAIAGHIWTVFLNFRGGKGVATSAGVFAALLPVPLALAFGVFLITVAITKHISVGSMAASVVLPFFCYFFSDPYQKPFTILAFCVCLLIFCTHISNIRRILRGEELTYRKKDNEDSKK
ncbi:MAG: glycerol-3-phosphate 1-O-acyltransferase PlsY [Elusimicrobiales bacterium]|nr:glycerol-3-phosphate 1-O-acyltransferase PlsY [Elusimicrobiales bacterium]